MANVNQEIERRTATALAAIKQAMNANDEDSGVPLFVSHHLDEIEDSYWQEHTDSPHPKPEQVLDLLEIRSHWGDDDDDGIDTFDFTLPNDATNYVIAVRFGNDGQVEEITMES